LKTNTWQGAIWKALMVQVGLVGFLSLGWFGLLPGLQGADNPLWFYLAAVLQFPASLLFTAVLGPIAKVFPDDVLRRERPLLGTVGLRVLGFGGVLAGRAEGARDTLTCNFIARFECRFSVV
jgi:hypothetical protein